MRSVNNAPLFFSSARDINNYYYEGMDANTIARVDECNNG